MIKMPNDHALRAKAAMEGVVRLVTEDEAKAALVQAICDISHAIQCAEDGINTSGTQFHADWGVAECEALGRLHCGLIGNEGLLQFMQAKEIALRHAFETQDKP